MRIWTCANTHRKEDINANSKNQGQYIFLHTSGLNHEYEYVQV